MEHCDFVPLRNMLIRTYLQDLKEVTNNVLYENFRCRKLAGVAGAAMDKIPNKVIILIYLTPNPKSSS
jgi:septin 7